MFTKYKMCVLLQQWDPVKAVLLHTEELFFFLSVLTSYGSLKQHSHPRVYVQQSRFKCLTNATESKRMQGGAAVSHKHTHIKITHLDMRIFKCVSITLSHQHVGLNSSLHPGGGDTSQNGGGGKCNLSLNINFMRLSLSCWWQICFRHTIWQVYGGVTPVKTQRVW